VVVTGLGLDVLVHILVQIQIFHQVVSSKLPDPSYPWNCGSNEREVKLRNLGEFCTIWQKGERPQAGSKLSEFISLFKVPKDIHTVTMDKKTRENFRQVCEFIRMSHIRAFMYMIVLENMYCNPTVIVWANCSWLFDNVITSALLDKRCEVIVKIYSIKFWKRYENLRPVTFSQKPIFRNIERFLHFWPVSYQKVFLFSSKIWKLFFFIYGEWGIKKPVFSYWFQKCKCDLSKKCTQVSDFHRPTKVLCQTSEHQNHWSLIRGLPFVSMARIFRKMFTVRLIADPDP
jgi:hypothetical protein